MTTGRADEKGFINTTLKWTRLARGTRTIERRLQLLAGEIGRSLALEVDKKRHDDGDEDLVSLFVVGSIDRWLEDLLEQTLESLKDNGATVGQENPTSEVVQRRR